MTTSQFWAKATAAVTTVLDRIGPSMTRPGTPVRVSAPAHRPVPRPHFGP